MDARLGEDIHTTPEELFEILLEPDKIQERPVVLHLDQQIDIAVGSVIAAGDGTEDAHVPRAVPGGNAQDLVTVLVNRHGQLSQAL
jgi:hypothetical protein